MGARYPLRRMCFTSSTTGKSDRYGPSSIRQLSKRSFSSAAHAAPDAVRALAIVMMCARCWHGRSMWRAGGGLTTVDEFAAFERRGSSAIRGVAILPIARFAGCGCRLRPFSKMKNRMGVVLLDRLVRFKSVAVTIAIRPKRNVVDVRSHNPLGLEHVTPRIGRNRDQERYDGRPQQHDPLQCVFLSM
jgi:hypothetical protein